MDLAWADIGLASAPERLGLETEYVFQEGNRFEGDPNAMQAATRAFQHGSLSEACLALEAVVKANPGALRPLQRHCCWCWWRAAQLACLHRAPRLQAQLAS